MATTVDTSGLENYERLFKNIPKEQRSQKLSEWGKKGNRQGKSKGGQASAAKRWGELQKRRFSNYVHTSFEMAIQNIVETVQFDIKYRFMQEIDRFYDDKVFRDGTSNQPVMYDRTGSLEFAFKPLYERIGNTYIFGGEVDGANIPSTPYYGMFSNKPMDPRYVFNQFYYLGKHGDDIKFKTESGEVFTSWQAPTTIPSPSFKMNVWWKFEYRSTIAIMLLKELNRMLDKNISLIKKG